MKRRNFITLLGGAAAAWPLAARAQQREQVRRIGVLVPYTADDAEVQARVGAFLQELQQSGWTIGRNVRIDIRWAGGKRDDIRRHAAELVALRPDVILAQGGSTLGPLLQATRTVPIVFPGIVDPVGAGFVDSLARPGGNVTGFMSMEYSATDSIALEARWPDCNQPQGSEGARCRRSVASPANRRRGDRIKMLFAAARTVAIGTIPAATQHVGRFRSEADID